MKTQSGPITQNCEGSFLSGVPVYNTFAEDSNWLQRHSTIPIFLITALIGYAAFTVNWDFGAAARNKAYDEMAVTVVDFGDFIPLSKRRAGGAYVEIDEVFGNQYIKDKAKVFDPDRDLVDPRIGTAVNPVISNATAPVDLNPEIIPEYPQRAKSAGIEGALVLELIIGDEGKVLRAKVAGKKLGHGLDQAAIECYEKKKFKPSINAKGEKITVKIYQPVRFRLF